MNNRTIQQKRLQKEFEMVADNKIVGINVLPVAENLCKWIACIKGPDDTPYSEGNFEIHIEFPDNYPFEPPKVVFNTTIFHPNISPDGKICVDILKDKWVPSLTILKVLLSILSLLSSPNPKDPLVPEVANLYMNNPTKFDAMARMYTKKYAIPIEK